MSKNRVGGDFVLDLSIEHVGLFIKDIEVSKQFYCQVLEFKLIHENTLDDGNGRLIKVAFVRSGSCVI